jgi:Cu(I)/Ag(I) efflux system membrane fusion protein
MTDAARRAHIAPAILAAIAMVVALVFRHELIAWFTGTPATATHAAPAAGDPASKNPVAYYTCAMHPQVHQGHPGTCPICSMPLVPVLREEEAAGMIRVDERRRGELGIATTTAVTLPLQLEIRAEGRLVVDETRLHDVTLKIGGYVSQLAVNATGQHVGKGDVLLALYSPELYAAQLEYLNARQRRDTSHTISTAGAAGDSTPSDPMVRASETKLRLWGFGDDQLRAIAETNQPIERVPFRSPAAGVVIEKAVVEGDAVTAGQRLFRIADLDQIWVEADVHETDLARIAKGDAATVTLPYLPGRTFAGKVAFVYPYLDPMSRTGRVRIALANKQLELKPDMFATVVFAVTLGARLQIPSAAVVYTGPRRLVFVDLGDGRLRPQEVAIGARSGDMVEVVSGLHDGDAVVSAGNFLVAAESRIRSTGAFWGGSGGGSTTGAGGGSAEGSHAGH